MRKTSFAYGRSGGFSLGTPFLTVRRVVLDGTLSRRPGTQRVPNTYSKICITHKTTYKTVCYNWVFSITRFKNGSQKCIDYIEK